MMQTSYKSSIKLVVFKLFSEEFGIEIKKINSIIRMQTITEIPYAVDFIEGIINFRDKPLVIIDLKKKFGLLSKDKEKNKKQLDEMRIIVLDFHPFLLGMIVDNVSEVLTLSYSDIEPVPEHLLTLDIEEDYLLGVGNLENGERLIVLLDLVKIFSEDELNQLGLIFGEEHNIRNYFDLNTKKKEQIKSEQRKVSSDIYQNSKDSNLRNETKIIAKKNLNKEKLIEKEKEMIHRLALRDIQEEFGINFENNSSEQEIIYVDEEGNEISPEELEKMDYVYVDEEIQEKNIEEIPKIKDPIVKVKIDETNQSKTNSDIDEMIAAAENGNMKTEINEEKDSDRLVRNDEIADLIKAVQDKKRKKNEMDKSKEIPPKISKEMEEEYKKKLGYNTKNDLETISKDYKGLEITTKMLKSEMIDEITKYMMDNYPNKIKNQEY